MNKQQKILKTTSIFALVLGLFSIVAFTTIKNTEVKKVDQIAYQADLYHNYNSSSFGDFDLGKCGAGKCGDDKKAKKDSKCGTGKCGDDKKAKTDSKCGAGKCGDDKKTKS